MAGEQRWTHYFNFSSIEKNRINGHCKLCNQDYKDKDGIFSNFLKHIKRKHPREYDQIFSKHGDGLSDDLTLKNSQQSSELSSKSKQNRINVAIAKYLIIKCNLPLSLVENNASRDFLKECSIKWDPISSKRLKYDGINSFTEKVNKTIYQTLEGVDYLTLTVDGWSDRKCRSFLGITSHFINRQMEPESYLIDFVRLKSSHTGENIHQTTESVLHRFNIKEEVFRIVTDNASSMIKAYKFGLSINDNDEIDDDGDDIKLLVDTNITLSDYDQDVDINDLKFMNIECQNIVNGHDDPSDLRLSCFAHSLQLCIRDGLKNTTYLPKAFAKCQVLAKFSHKSSKMAVLLDQLNTHIHKMNVTRWNSEYMLIKSIASIGKNDLELITSVMDNPIKFSNNDFIILKEVIDILEPFCEISTACQADMAVTASLVVPSIAYLINHLRDVKENISWCSKLVQQLQTSIKTRFCGITNRFSLQDVDDYTHYDDPLYFIAAVLDPAFKFHWIRDLQLHPQTENCLKQNIIKFIIDEMNKDSKSSENGFNQNDYSLASSSLSNFTSTPKPKRRKLFHYDDDSNEVLNESTTLDPAVELDAYLNDPIRVKFSDYWFHSKLNILKKLVKRIFSVQASSAPIERAFSHAGLIFSSRRTNLSERLFRDLVFLRVNQNVL